MRSSSLHHVSLTLALLCTACSAPPASSLEPAPRTPKNLDGCIGLSAEAICHSCMHAVAGPYGNGGNPVVAQPSSSTFIYQSADIVHNLYRIHLPETEPGSGEHEGVLLYLPTSDERVPHAIWLSRELEVRAFAYDYDDLMTTEIEAVFEQRFTEETSPDCQEVGYVSLVSNCHQHFPYVIAFDMIGDGSEDYHVYFSGTNEAEFQTVFENLSAIGQSYYADVDDDGFGSVLEQIRTACIEGPAGYVQVAGDCAPDDPSVHPGAQELCNGMDEDCDEVVDEDCEQETPGDAGVPDAGMEADAGVDVAVDTDASLLPSVDAGTSGDAGSSDASGGGGCSASSRGDAGSLFTTTLALILALACRRRRAGLTRP